MELYNAMKRLKKVNNDIIRTPFVFVMMILRSRLPKDIDVDAVESLPKPCKNLSKTLAPSSPKDRQRIGRRLPKSDSKRAIYRLKSGIHTAVWNFHTPV